MKKYWILLVALSSTVLSEDTERKNEDYIAALLRENQTYGSATYRRMAYEQLASHKSISPETEVNYGLYGINSFFLGGPEFDAAKARLKNDIARFSSSKLDKQSFLEVASIGAEELRRLEDWRLLVASERESAKGLLGDLSSGIIGAVPGGGSVTRFTNPAMKYFLGEAIINRIPGLNAELKKDQEQALSAKILAIYGVKMGNIKITLDIDDIKLIAPELQLLAEKAAEEHDIGVLKNPDIRKQFLDVPVGQRDAYLASLVEVVNRVTAKNTKEIADIQRNLKKNSGVGRLTYDGLASLEALHVYATVQLKAAIKKLADGASSMSKAEINRLGKLMESHRQMAEAGAGGYPALARIIREQSGLRQNSDKTNERLSFIISQMSPETRLEANRRGLHPLRPDQKAELQARSDEREKTARTQELLQDVQLVTTSANVLIDSAVLFGRMSPKQANELRSGLQVLGGAAMAVGGVYSGDPMLAVGGISTFIGGLGGLMGGTQSGPDLRPILVYLQEMHRDLTRQITEVKEKLQDLNETVLRSHKIILEKLDQEFTIVKYGLALIEDSFLNSQHDEYFSACDIFHQRLNIALGRLEMKSTDLFYSPTEVQKIMQFSGVGDLAIQWHRAFESLIRLTASDQGKKLNDFFLYRAEIKRNPEGAIQESLAFRKSFRLAVSLLSSEFEGTFPRGSDPKKFLSALAARSPDAASLKEKADQLESFKAPPELVENHFDIPASSERIRDFANYLTSFYPFSYAIDTEGKFLNLGDQLKPLVTSRTNKSPAGNRFIGPGSSILYYEALAPTRDSVLLGLSQQSFLTGDLFLLIIDSIFERFEAHYKSSVDENPACVYRAPENYLQLVELLNSNRLLAMNYLSYRFYKRGASALESYRAAYSAPNSKILEAWIAKNNIFGEKLLDAGTFKLLGWREFEDLMKIERLNRHLVEIRDTLSRGTIERQSAKAESLNEDAKKTNVEIEKLKQVLRLKNANCDQGSNGYDYKWYVMLPHSSFYIALPTPQQMCAKGELLSSVQYNNLRQVYHRLEFIYDDMIAPTHLKPETFGRIESFQYEAVLNP